MTLNDALAPPVEDAAPSTPVLRYRGIAGHAPIVLWAVPVSDIGGVARHVLDVARVGLPRTRLVVLCPEGPLAERLHEMGVPVLIEDFGPDAGVPASVRSLRHAVAKLRPAVLHTHLAYADIIAALAIPPSWPVRLVSTEHGIAGPGSDSVYHSSRISSTLMAAAHTARCERFDALVAVSEATAGAMRRTWHPRRPITVIHNGIDPVAASPAAPGMRFLSLARLAPEKRIVELLKAFSVVHRDHPEARLTVAGTGPLVGELRRAASALGLDNCVSFPGFVDAATALSSHDVLVQLSTWENCSYSLLDAAAHGLGVVATPVGGNPEILPARCLVEANNLRGLAAAMTNQALQPTHRPGLGTWPSIDSMAAGIVRVYRGCFA